MSPSAGLVAMFGRVWVPALSLAVGMHLCWMLAFFGPVDAKSLGRHKDEIGRA
jgi:hypothetical protein